jgi:hypothetical protein
MSGRDRPLKLTAFNICNLAPALQCQGSRHEFSNQLGEPTMFESATKISVEHLPGNRGFHVHKNETALFTFTRVKVDDKNVEHRFETSAATVCFVRGTGRIAINGGVVEYGGKWFEIPRKIEYQIFPETDTLILTIRKPEIPSIDKDDTTSDKAIYDSYPLS